MRVAGYRTESRLVTDQSGWQGESPKRGLGTSSRFAESRNTRESPLLKSALLKGLPGTEVPPFQSHSYELSMALSLHCSFWKQIPIKDLLGVNEYIRWFS